MPEKKVPQNVQALIRKWYTGPDSCAYVRRRLRRHHAEWSSMTDGHIERAYRNYSAPRKNEVSIDLNEPRPITLAGPRWSWPNRQGISA